MARIGIIGDGPAGLSAALFLARGDQDTIVFGTDETAMHWAHLHNYLGIEDLGGTAFQRTARGQVEAAGATLRAHEVTEVRVAADGASFTIVTADTTDEVDYVVLAGGKAVQSLAEALGAERDGGHVVVDTEQRTAVDRVYAAGRVVRPERSQAVISAGAGAIAALDILSRESGKDVHDWDSPPKED
ncbi:MAG: FAD-dependent oxidoreductase [Nitriliruptoraceae bacterium]|nr:FAD-dependent oxidoreductase [Nitriliruptoraceae bacterium]